MNTRQIEYILAIAEENNMQRAAERLFVTQSTLSQTLIKLERELGCQLFVRNSREMTLTQAGQAYVNGGQKILGIKEDTYQAIHALKNQHQRIYRIGISSHSSMERFLMVSGELQKVWQDIEIYAIEDHYKNLINKLSKKELQLIIITWGSLSDIPSPYKVIKKEEIKLVAPADWHPRQSSSESPSVAWEQLSEERLILPPQGSTVRSIADSMLSRFSFYPRITYETGNIETTLMIVQQKRGLGFLPENLLPQNTSHCFYSLDPPFIRYQVIVYNQEAEQDEILQQFIALSVSPDLLL